MKVWFNYILGYSSVNPLKLIAALHVLFETMSYNHLDSMYEKLWVVKICYLSVSCLLSYCHDYMTSWIICLNLCYVNRFIEHKLCGIHVLNKWKQNLPWEHVILWCIRLIYVVFCYVLKDIYLTFDYMNSWLYVNLLALKLKKNCCIHAYPEKYEYACFLEKMIISDWKTHDTMCKLDHVNWF